MLPCETVEILGDEDAPFDLLQLDLFSRLHRENFVLAHDLFLAVLVTRLPGNVPRSGVYFQDTVCRTIFVGYRKWFSWGRTDNPPSLCESPAGAASSPGASPGRLTAERDRLPPAGYNGGSSNEAGRRVLIHGAGP